MTVTGNDVSVAQNNLIDHLKRQEAEYVVATALIRKMSALNDVSSDKARFGMVSLQQSLVRIRQLGENVAQATQTYEREGLARSAKLSVALDDQTKNLQVFLDEIDSVKEVFSGVRDRMLPQLDEEVTRRAMHQAYQRTMKTG
jgi:hypothetical protein